MHVPVLPGPALDWLRVRPDGVYVDCTAGYGGHAELIAQRLTSGRLLALDRDPEAVERVRRRLSKFPQADVVHANYSELTAVLRERHIAEVDGVLIDAGMSSAQLDDPRRGFAFQADGPLDMRLDTGQSATARDLLMRATESELVELLRAYGDVRPAKRIARAIVQRREQGRMNTTADLRDAVHEALSFVTGTPDEVRTVFQAVRIAVNDEYAHLEAGLRAGIDALAPGGRIVAISFHSGEDRIVKNILREESRPRREFHPDGRIAAERPPRLHVLTHKPVTADAAELAANPRAHSARLRAAERLPENAA